MKVKLQLVDDLQKVSRRKTYHVFRHAVVVVPGEAGNRTERCEQYITHKVELMYAPGIIVLSTIFTCTEQSNFAITSSYTQELELKHNRSLRARFSV